MRPSPATLEAVSGQLGGDGWVTDATAISANATEIEMTDLLEEQPLTSIEFRMTGGGVIRVDGGRARLELLSATEMLDRWVGPL